MTLCCVPLCNNKSDKGKNPAGLQFYRFPVDTKECNRWLELIRYVSGFETIIRFHFFFELKKSFIIVIQIFTYTLNT